MAILKGLLLIGCIIVVTAGFSTEANQLDNLLLRWNAYKVEHGKKYASPTEEAKRFEIFAKNKLKIDQFNAEESNKAGYKQGLNRFSDMTKNEIRGFLGVKPKSPTDRLMRANSVSGERYLAAVLGDNLDSIPESMDWRNVSGRVSKVKDLGDKCGAAWAFATTGLLEGQQLQITKGEKLIELSEQNLIDCATTNDCTGGWPARALFDIFESGGIESGDLYPYIGHANKKCSFNDERSIMNTRGPIVLPESEEKLKAVVAKYGPVSIVFNAPDEFIYYEKGILKVLGCVSDFSRAMILMPALVVGYGNDPVGGDYWLLKNSWGSNWGEEGYFRMARNNGNMCGVASMAVIAEF